MPVWPKHRRKASEKQADRKRVMAQLQKIQHEENQRAVCR